MVAQIAKSELRNLFYSPVAWFLALVFTVQCGYLFVEVLYTIVHNQEVMKAENPDFKDWGQIPLTMLFFSIPNSAYAAVLNNIYLFVPLLTMGLIGREVHANTIKLLFSSPVKLRQVVAGKFLAIMVYNFVLLMILGIFLLSFGLSVRSADYGFILSGALAFYLLICAYTSIGLFMSSLTNYQILAAVSTFIVIFVLSRVDKLWQHVEFVRDLTWFLHLPGHTARMLKGLIASKDLIYFVLVVCMFLGFTLVQLKRQRESKPWYITIFRISIIVIVVLAAGYLFSRPQTTGYVDATATNANTIHPVTQSIIREMEDGPLEITLYTNLLGKGSNYGIPEARNVYLTELWEQYQRFKPDIYFRFVNYYHYEPWMDSRKLAMAFPGKSNEEIAREIAKGMQLDFNDFIPLAAIKDTVNLASEGYRLVMRLKYKGRTAFLRTYESGAFPKGAPRAYPEEANVVATLKRLVKPETIPTILYTSGNLERGLYKTADRDYTKVTLAKFEKNGPINLGFNFDTISLESQEIPTDLTALVIADPKREFSALAQQKVTDYINKGGNIIFMGEPGKQNVLNPLLKPLGVEMMDGILVEPTYHEMPDKVNPYYTVASADLAGEPALQTIKSKMMRVYDKDTTKMLMPGVAALSFTDSSGFVKRPLLLTRESGTWLKKGKLVVDSAAVVYNPKEGDMKGAFPTALQLTRQVGSKQQHAVVFGDADFVSNVIMRNGLMIKRSVLSWMTNNEYPLYLTRPDPADNLLLISSGTVKWMKVIYVWVLPALMLVAGVLILVRRKRK
ncbi:Gldg family protein [Pseudoflavitalea rhizosphaerae]|uniref:Gldg family protein n=1 Tax=Pseudoflavitalea rhizosphaerae TaxID=1884793 RepID=UPI0013E01FCF|nr:Gldg family protein [Pseudoflavitalea rhizosphaerae]